ncbi:2-hydroxychromene-2-carboxylate isomerase [Microbaculum marinum]|uniref:2-hydroxychromene-2-carboxylate isomerase n=1 Tax=Microbaculum marinum TaxID=1764581 RepID=A0AAW9S3R8_9HYPH
MKALDFWFEFASTYSYLTAMRIEAAARRAGVEVRWKPFLLGPVFAGQGLSTSPFNIYPLKGGNMLRDVERIAAAMGLGFRTPDPFPQNGLTAARIALIGCDEDWGADFTRAVYLAEFDQGRQISDKAVLSDILHSLGQDPEAVLQRSESPENKARLKAQTETAMQLNMFGAPTFMTEDGELFWGNDRLEQALYWARHHTLEGFFEQDAG